MEFIVDREDLIRISRYLEQVVGTSSSNVAATLTSLTVDGTRLTMTGSGPEVDMEAHAECEVLSVGTTHLPAKIFATILRQLPKEQQLKIKLFQGRLALSTDPSAKKLNEFPTKLSVVSDALVPTLTFSREGPKALSADGLVKALSKVSYASFSTKLGQGAVFTGIMVEFAEENSRCVATDSNRLAVCDFGKTEGMSGSYLLPSKAAAALETILRLDGSTEPLTVSAGSGRLFLSSESYSLAIRLMEGNFPNFTPLFDRSLRASFSVNTKALKELLRRAKTLSSEGLGNTVTLTLGDGKLSIYASGDYGETEGSIEIAWNKRPTLEPGDQLDTITLRYNADYIVDAVNQFDTDSFDWNIHDSGPPANTLTSEGGYKALISPLKNNVEAT